MSQNTDYEFVRIEMVDLYGVSRGIFATKEYFLASKDKGVPFPFATPAFSPGDDLADDTGFIGETGGNDAVLYPDLSTFQLLPWLPDTATILGDFRLLHNNPNSTRHPICSRGILQIAVNKLAELGLSIYGSFEQEFSAFHFDTGECYYKNSVFQLTSENIKSEVFIKEFIRAVKEFNIHPLKFHVEYSYNMLEVTYKPSYGMHIADDFLRVRQILKEIAVKHGLQVTFMTKPSAKHECNTASLNHSIWNNEGKNAFYDLSDKHKLSQLARYWIAGLQKHSNALLAISTGTPNCLNNYREDFLYPVYNVWGLDNRSVCYRVKTLDEQNTFIESRAIRSATNPYLCVAAHIYAGIDGIKRNLESQIEPFEGAVIIEATTPSGLTRLPVSFKESLECLKSDKLFCQEFGSDVIKAYIALKDHEIQMYENAKENNQVEKWEKQRYFEYF